jgi:uncharacterized protein (TIGR03083 family)
VEIGIEDQGPELVAALRARSRAVCDALDGLVLDEVRAHSLLPDWSRLTIACHLRYSARTLRRMSEDALRGRPTAYYPEGRQEQRPRTLRPEPLETASDVLAGLHTAVDELCKEWTALDRGAWRTAVAEPPDNPDLGPTTLAMLAMAGLTEFEVHGTDLDVGLPDWSPRFVELVLPARVLWLNHRRTNHRAVDDSIRQTWQLQSYDGGLRYLISTATGSVVARAASAAHDAATTITASRRDLLALLLGRPFRGDVTASTVDGISEFQAAFPGP